MAKKKEKAVDHGAEALIVMRYLAKYEGNMRAIMFLDDRWIEWKDA